MKRKKEFIALTTATMVAATAIVPVASANSLTDLKGFPYQDEIEQLVKEGVISGFPNKTFQPYKALTRSDVVKILGKYMVSLGYEIPADYKTNMRFKDLSSKSNDELLQYAALVKDYGVFNGSEHKLLSQNRMTNGQAANVLVRAFSEIDQYDYAEHVKNETFMREFLDVSTILGELKQSIDVMDYFDIVERDYYNANVTMQRGYFASMLYRMAQLKKSTQLEKVTLQSIVATTPTHLTVTLSDASTHSIYLDVPLIENTETAVSFDISGTKYSGTATYYTKALQVTKVENLNGGQFMIYFNQEVDLPSTYNSSDLEKIMSLKRNGSSTSVTFQKGELQDDLKSYKVTINSQNALSGSYNFKLSGVRALTGKALVNFENTYNFESDIVSPTIVETKSISQNLVKVVFSEPVYSKVSGITYKLADGTAVTGVVAKYMDAVYNAATNKTEIVFDLTNARAKSALADFAKVNVTITGLRDITGNFTSPNPYTFTIQKGGADGKPAQVESVVQTGAKQFKVKFNEPVDMLYSYQLAIQSTNTNYYIEDIEQLDDKETFVVTVDKNLDGNITIHSTDNYPLTDATGTSGPFSVTHTFEYNTEKAYVERTKTIREENFEYLYIYFDRPVVFDDESTVKFDGSYTLNNQKRTVTNAADATVYPTEQSNVVKVLMKDLVENFDREGAVFNGTLNFSNVFNEHGKTVVNGDVQFTRTSDYTYNTEQLKLLSVETSRTSKEVTDNRLLVLQFNYPVDETLAADMYNYDLIGYKLTSAKVNTANPTQVLLRYDNTISKPVEPYLYVWNLRAQNALVDMDVFYEKVYLNENVGPKFTTFTVTGTNEIQLTFDEALLDIDSRTFYVTDSNGQSLGASATIDANDSRKVVLTLEKALVPATDIQIRLTAGRVVQDLYYNEGAFTTIIRSVPSSIPSN